MKVNLRFWDIDQHDLDCECYDHSSVTKKSYGYALFEEGAEEPLEVVYGPSEFAGQYNARLIAKDRGWEIVPEEDHEQSDT